MNRPNQREARKFPFVDRPRLKRAAVLCHRNADADAYLSAFAVSHLIRALAPRCAVDIATPEGVTTLTSKLLKEFPHETLEESDRDYDLYVAVDVGDTELLKGWYAKMEGSPAVKVLVDHHPIRNAGAYDHLIVDENATSASEVVLGLFVALKVGVDKSVAQALLEGIMFDSSHLTIAGEGALRSVVELIDRGADIQKARRDLRSEPEYGEVIARVKGVRRAKVFRYGDWTVAVSEVGSYQAHVARSLVSMGIDVAVVGGNTDGETRVSLRSGQRFYDSTKVHLGSDVAERVASALGGHGGGHPTAASFSCDHDEEEAVRVVLDTISTLLGVGPKEVG